VSPPQQRAEPRPGTEALANAQAGKPKARLKPSTTVAELRALAVQYRTNAVPAMEAGDLETVERLESLADRCYARARELGDTGYQVDRLNPDETPHHRFCVVCRGRFMSDRSSAKYCSGRCRQRANRSKAGT
jgi:hypothetical protein